MTNEQLKRMFASITMIISCILIAVYMIWALRITIYSWDVPLTRWDNFLLYGKPLLYLALPALVFYVISSLISSRR